MEKSNPLAKESFQKLKKAYIAIIYSNNQYDNLSNPQFIRNYRYDYEYQKKENLVYCDLFEHLIFHTLIAKESNGIHGLAGYLVFILPNIEEWYVSEIDPILEWQKYCKDKANLSKEYTETIINRD